MPYVCNKYPDLENKTLLGSHQCVALVQECAKAPHTSLWKEGERVKGSLVLAPGTAIATFVKGRYPNQAHGNHAAIYVRQDSAAIYVLDQWKGKSRITIRPLYFKGKDKNGNYIDPSNNADAFSVID
ncbi:BPSL0067 family protein [Noviherbaspirillum cavernae]|uniref:BPSL0067 family protein n=1 Tax=Noviherbaspirillum cavernae TaxID=2320862 RepID=UPI0011C3D752|nr:BPSL0067 family protein [Noviherbaspirillum cavernae]